MLGLVVLLCCAQPEPLRSPLATLSDAPPPFEGVVAEHVPVDGYTYAHVDPLGDAPPVWVASLETELAVGDAVAVTPLGLARDFRSRQLGRTFDSLLFVTIRNGDNP